jgi:glycosyltransferase involved in cell wall biosynthesis
MNITHLPTPKKKLKICVISSTILHCPPKGYSGLEMLAWQIAEGLKSKGHEVMLVAPRGSTSSCEIHETTQYEPEGQAYSGYWHKLPNYDVIIDHSWEKWSYILKMEGKLNQPILGVLHAPVETMYVSPPPVPYPCFVCISKDQSDACSAHLKCSSRVSYNGVDVNFYKNTGKQRNNRYLFLARISTIKGPHIAVDVANNCKIGLDLVGDDKITGEPDLLNSIKQKCSVSPNLRYVGHQNRDECVSWFNQNKAMLHPNKFFREPFGLAPVEAQLCGMPVIAWNHGACKETIKHGETGFLVNTQEEMEQLIKDDAVSTIKPERCMEWARQFSYENMINRYEELCHEAISTGGW